MRIFKETSTFFLVLIFLSASVYGVGYDVDSDLKNTKNFSFSISCKKSNADASIINVKRTSWTRLFAITSLLVSLDAKWVGNDWVSDKSMIGMPAKVVDTVWSGKYFCNKANSESELSIGCYDSIEGKEELIYWKPLGFNNPVPLNYTYQDDVILSTRWVNVDALRCSENKCYYLEHQFAYHESERLWSYTGRYRDIPDFPSVSCTSARRLEKIDDEPKCVNGTLVQSVSVTGEYSCANGVKFTNTTHYENCPLIFSHKGFSPKNSSHYLQTLKWTACNSTLIDENEVLLDRCEHFKSEHRIDYFSLKNLTYIDTSKALGRDDFKGSLWLDRYFIVNRSSLIDVRNLDFRRIMMFIGTVIAGGFVVKSMSDHSYVDQVEKYTKCHFLPSFPIRKSLITKVARNTNQELKEWNKIIKKSKARSRIIENNSNAKDLISLTSFCANRIFHGSNDFSTLNLDALLPTNSKYIEDKLNNYKILRDSFYDLKKYEKKIAEALDIVAKSVIFNSSESAKDEIAEALAHCFVRKNYFMPVKFGKCMEVLKSKVNKVNIDDIIMLLQQYQTHVNNFKNSLDELCED